MVFTNLFLQDAAAANTLHTLHLLAHSSMQPLELEPATLAALPNWTSLRELVLVGTLPWDSVVDVLQSMPVLQVFENWWCSDRVAKDVADLRRMRPDMKRIHVQWEGSL